MPAGVKICGLTTAKSIGAAVKSGADYLGFVFYPPSPRNITPVQAEELCKTIPPQVKKVAVTVDAGDALLGEIVLTLAPDYIQLHGNESPERVKEIKTLYKDIGIIKAIAVSSAEELQLAKQYVQCADMLLFDARSDEKPLPGGNGITFDWNIIRGASMQPNWFLSGGINASNVARAIVQTGTHLVDVSSGVESSPGVKDIAMIKQFIMAAKNA